LQKLQATEQNDPTPSTSRHVEEARSPEETEEVQQSSDSTEEEEVVVKKKSPPKKLPDHPALVTLPKRRLFKHKDPGSGKGLLIKSNILVTIYKCSFYLRNPSRNLRRFLTLP
jgi:hypothetical protein